MTFPPDRLMEAEGEADFLLCGVWRICYERKNSSIAKAAYPGGKVHFVITGKINPGDLSG